MQIGNGTIILYGKVLKYKNISRQNFQEKINYAKQKGKVVGTAFKYFPNSSGPTTSS